MGATVVHCVAFADGEGGGNPCPVVFGADAWDGERMRAAAARFGHETCFVLPVEDGVDADVRYRYFVPNHEMEMCVHATVAATVLRGGDARVQTPLGVREVRVEGDRAVVEQFAPVFGEPVADTATVTAALGGAAPASSRCAPATTRTRRPASPPARSGRTSPTRPAPPPAGIASRSPRAAPWAGPR